MWWKADSDLRLKEHLLVAALCFCLFHHEPFFFFRTPFLVNKMIKISSKFDQSFDKTLKNLSKFHRNFDKTLIKLSKFHRSFDMFFQSFEKTLM